MNETVDITPTPRILRTLGDIPFEAWQCLAELADNGLDSLHDSVRAGIEIKNPQVELHWSSEDTPPKQREVVIRDNGPGMSLDILQNAAKAGYSSHAPVDNLGLFGMGFNIATARLGDETEFFSTTEESSEWVGIRISFEELIKSRKFSAPIVRREKTQSDSSGTMIVVRQLKDGVFSELKRKESTIRRRLESIYSPILAKNQFDIYVQSKKLSARLHCVWTESRFVVRKGKKIHAIQHIDKDFGDTYFDLSKNRYLSDGEVIEIESAIENDQPVPKNVVKRPRRLKGWIGIQRYSDPSDFGIDFVRNGRKILIGDKSLFGCENPDTGTVIQEYPVELGSTVGGRIVGEIHVDYLIPTYQKNGFDTTDRVWRLTVDALRGAGPILPKKRTAYGYSEDNESPIGLLVNGYRRVDPGTKNLAIANSLARSFYSELQSGNLEYESDDKWFKAAQEADRERGEKGSSTRVNPGDNATDDVDEYGPSSSPTPDSTPTPTSASESSIVPQRNSTRDELILHSEKVENLSGQYSYNVRPGFNVTVHAVNSCQIRIGDQRVPCHLFQDGIETDFFFDSAHQILAEYPITPKQLLLYNLAERFSLRDRGTSIQSVFIGLVENHLEEERIFLPRLQESAKSKINDLKERLPSLVAGRMNEVIALIESDAPEQVELAKQLIEEAPQLFTDYQNKARGCEAAITYIADETLARLIGGLPELFLDNKLIKLPYNDISIGNESITQRLKQYSVEKAVSYVKDLIQLTKGSGSNQSKQELVRFANTLSLLETLIIA